MGKLLENDKLCKQMLFRKQGQKLWHLFFVNENIVQQNAGRTTLQLTFWGLSYHPMSRTEEA